MSTRPQSMLKNLTSTIKPPGPGIQPLIFVSYHKANDFSWVSADNGYYTSPALVTPTQDANLLTVQLRPQLELLLRQADIECSITESNDKSNGICRREDGKRYRSANSEL